MDKCALERFGEATFERHPLRLANKIEEEKHMFYNHVNRKYRFIYYSVSITEQKVERRFYE